MRRLKSIFAGKTKVQVPTPEPPVPANEPVSQQSVPPSNPIPRGMSPSSLPTIRPARPGSLAKLSVPSGKKAHLQPKEPTLLQEDPTKRNPQRDVPLKAKGEEARLIGILGKRTIAQRISLKAFEERHEKINRQVAAIAPIGAKNSVFVKAVEDYFKGKHAVKDPKQSGLSQSDIEDVFKSMARETFQSSFVEPWKGAFEMVGRINERQKAAGSSPEQIKQVVAEALAVSFAQMIRKGQWPTH